MKRGRKKIDDKKIQVNLYILQSTIERFNGLESLKKYLYERLT